MAGLWQGTPILALTLILRKFEPCRTCRTCRTCAAPGRRELPDGQEEGGVLRHTPSGAERDQRRPIRTWLVHAGTAL